MDYGTESVIELEHKGRFAILTINKPNKLNALSRAQYYELAQNLREIADRSDVYVIVLLAKGRFFSVPFHSFIASSPPGAIEMVIMISQKASNYVAVAQTSGCLVQHQPRITKTCTGNICKRL
jgi:hypothetical protein